MGRGHGIQFSHARMRNVCRCGSDLPCQEVLTQEMWVLSGLSDVAGAASFPPAADDPAAADFSSFRLRTATQVSDHGMGGWPMPPVC